MPFFERENTAGCDNFLFLLSSYKAGIIVLTEEEIVSANGGNCVILFYEN